MARPVRRERHGLFCRQGDPAVSLFMVVHGQVIIRQAGAEGEEVTLRWVGPGGIFGEAALLEHVPYQVSAVAAQEALALAFDGGELRAMMAKCPALALNGLELAIMQLLEMRERCRELATERVERRIARSLLRFAHQTGRWVDGGIAIDAPLSREEIGRLTGTTLFTVSRTLSAWERQGLIRLGRRQIVIIQPRALARLAEGRPPASQG